MSTTQSFLLLGAAVASSVACTSARHDDTSAESSRVASRAVPGDRVAFERVRLSTEFTCEGATFADLDRDGDQDVIAGPWWYEGPDWKTKHALYAAKTFDPAGYSDNFFAWTRDLDGDGWLDVLVVGFPGAEAHWYRNPILRGKDATWERFLVAPIVDNESPAFADVDGDGDGAPELVCQRDGRFGWAAPVRGDARAEWTWHPISEKTELGKFTHGLGVGDVNGDGRADVLWKGGWFEQPSSLAGDPVWTHHAFAFSDREGGAQMYTVDVDGDGDRDVITSLAAHRFGLSWFEQTKDAAGAITFVEHRVMDDSPAKNAHGACFGELHALDLADVNGDGLPDVVTGKRWWSHGAQGDPQPGSKAEVWWFELARRSNGANGVDFVPHLADDDSGVGVQLVTGDVDGDGRRDVVIGNKRGACVLLQRTRTSSTPAKTVIDASKPQAPASNASEPDLGFESGTLRGWTATGHAFDDQPVRGDTVSARGREASRHDGDWWIGGYEKHGDAATGTLTSIAFVVEKPWASFLVGGGASDATRVELVDAADGNVLFKTSGANYESMQRVVVDLHAELGKKILVRLVDESAGGWGHVNFDDLRFHDAKPSFDRPADVPPILVPDVVLHAGLSPADAVKAMAVPDGFHVDLIASEPDLQQPIAFTFDAKGRIWVAEAFSYPQKRAKGEGHDTIRVLEDRDADGTYETKTTFVDDLNLVSGLEVGHGGVWVGQAPELLFIPDANDDLVPDGPPQVVLDGFGFQDTHETLNAFNWGPDGWLYGCHGVFTHSRVGKPGTPDAERVPINAGIWRVHPKTHAFEVFAWGTSNPWGVDFDDHGQAFCTACVIPHLFHVIQGARYERQAGEHFGAYVFDDIKTIADHLHYLGNDPWAANRKSDSVGGGHAHCGAMIYLADQFPERYREALLVNNIHGNRVNMELLERKGSGFVGRHGEDFLRANDTWFRGVSLKTGPDGSVYLIDWYDAQACHLNDVNKWDRTNGRMYRVTYGKHHPVRVDLRAKTSAELVALQTSANEWYVRQARLVLAERGKDPATAFALRKLLDPKNELRVQLRALWALHASGNATDSDYTKPMTTLEHLHTDRDELVGWAIRLACESGTPWPPILEPMEQLARGERSPSLRLEIASALQRVKRDTDSTRRSVFAAARNLAMHEEDADDHNLPLMDWYAIEPLVPEDTAWALDVARETKIPLLATFIERRLAADAKTRGALVHEIDREPATPRGKRMLATLHAAVSELRDTPMPDAWPPLYAKLSTSDDATVRDEALAIAAAFGDAQAFPALRAILADAKAKPERREQALHALVRGKDAPSVPVLQRLLDEKPLRVAAIEALASFDDAKTPDAMRSRWNAFDAKERTAAIDTLSSRPSFAKELLAAVGSGDVQRTEVSAFVLRKLENLGDATIAKQVAALFGVVHPSKPEKEAKIAALKTTLTPDVLENADKSHGRAVFARTCERCHTLFDTGGTLAPNLTGSNRKDLDYLLTNVVDPNAVITKEYMITNVWLNDDQLVTGIVKKETDDALTLQSETATTVVDKREIAERKLSDLSTMPEGQLDTMTPEEVRDLVAYLQSPSQVPMRAAADDAKRFFDGKTLTGWTGDLTLWSVENGEIVGRTSGLAKNTFLVNSLELTDFHLELDLRLVDDAGNSGIQFRSHRIADGEMQGYQADVGPGWWGKLYEENGRALLVDQPFEQHVTKDGWNHYVIEARGHHIQTWLNGAPCVDLEDPSGADRGIVALQLHSGGPTEVRVRNLKLSLLDTTPTNSSR